MEENKTAYIRDEIGRCESVEELKEKIFPLLNDQHEAWQRKMNQIFEDSGMSKTEFARECRTSRVSLDKWLGGVLPKNRETFIRIGLTAGLDAEDINVLLQRYGRYPGLYSKNAGDCVCMYAARHYKRPETIRRYDDIMVRVNEETEGKNAGDIPIKTRYMDTQLGMVSSDAELEIFLKENAPVFASAYSRFYEQVKLYMEMNFDETGTQSVYEMALAQDWSSSLRQAVSEIRQGKWKPNRNKFISLGIHLNMMHADIDDMLEAAHMEPLCAKNIFESVIIFVLDDAEIKGKFDEKFVDPDMLCGCCRYVMEQLDIPDISDFISELPEMED